MELIVPEPRGLVVPEPRTDMIASGLEHVVDRAYEEGGRLQWAREAWKNSIEAGATRIEFGIEWQGVENDRVYRRVIADNGTGIPGDQMRTFFNVFGGGGKPIGGLHENFGVGFKTSVLPWNHYGVVVVSRYQGIASMIWIDRPEGQGYGMRNWQIEGNGWEEVLDVTPDDTGYGYIDPRLPSIDWGFVGPEWAREGG